MNQDVVDAIERLIFSHTGAFAQIERYSPISGGSISRAFSIELKDGRRYFVKTHSNGPSEMFKCEADGLGRLKNANAITTPDVIGYGDLDSNQFLILQWVETTPTSKDLSIQFGQQLAKFHRQSSSLSEGRFGLDHDNYLGENEQINTWSNSWSEFWCRNRLEFQLELARSKGHADQRFNQLGDALLNRVRVLLESVNESPALIHGDLWSGNYLFGPSENIVVVDPAVYFAHREAEFGMTTLFGGFSQRFYDAYSEIWPMTDGANERIETYRLYHLLNHLNLFGKSYLAECLEIMKKFQ